MYRHQGNINSRYRIYGWWFSITKHLNIDAYVYNVYTNAHTLTHLHRDILMIANDDALSRGIPDYIDSIQRVEC